MKNILIRKTKYSYRCEKKTDYSNYSLEILAEWFTDDVGNSLKTWREWLNDTNDETTESNATWLEKYDNKIRFGSIIDIIDAYGVYTPKEHEFIDIHADNVVELLNSWEKLLKTCPNEIMITEEDGVFKMFEVQ